MNTENSINIISRQFEVNDLTILYFSNDNVDLLQEQIRKYIWFHKDTYIGIQSYDDLKIIMRSTFILNKHKLTGSKNTIKQVKYLNKLVILECARIIIINLEQYIKYSSDIQETLNIQGHPISTSLVGTKTGAWGGA